VGDEIFCLCFVLQDSNQPGAALVAARMMMEGEARHTAGASDAVGGMGDSIWLARPERTLWPSVRCSMPIVAGVEQTRKLLDPTLASNTLMRLGR
jgi:hypothetical protein